MIIVFLPVTEVVAGQSSELVPSNISISDAAALINADKGGAIGSLQVAIAAVNGHRLDLVDYLLQSKAHSALHYVLDELRGHPYSEFKEQVVIRALRSKFGWPSDNSWASGGVTDPMPEPYLSVVTKLAPELLSGSELLATSASREMLASRLEEAINRESVTPIPRKPKPRPTPNDMESGSSNSASRPGSSSSDGSGNSTESVNQTSWMNCLWLAIATGGIAMVYVFLRKRNNFSKR